MTATKPTYFQTTYPVYENKNGNHYACGRSEEKKGKIVNAAYQIKNGKIYGSFRVIDFIDMDFIGVITVEYYDGETISKTF
jgi:hypothetical protein